MLTRAGWLLLAAAAAAAVTGRAFGVIELYVVAATLVLLVVVAVVYVRLARLRLRLSRAISPTRVHACGITRVEVAATNLARSRTPVLRFEPARRAAGRCWRWLVCPRPTGPSVCSATCR